MSTLLFHNPTPIDIRGAMVAGLSAKTTDAAIGKFGTGLKYAIAWIVARGGSIVITCNEDTYTFEAEPIDFRGKEHQLINMLHDRDDNPDTQRTPLNSTTHYGAHWKPWQIFRELYANALDEQGDVRLLSTGETLPPLPEDHTHILVQCPELEAIYHSRHDIILPPASPNTFHHRLGEIRPSRSNSLFYRGGRVCDFEAGDDPMPVTYNLTYELDITEDRTLTSLYTYRNYASIMVMLLPDEHTIRNILCSRHPFEVGLRFYATKGRDGSSYSPAFLSVATELYRSNPVTHSRLKSFLAEASPEVVRPIPIDLSPFHQKMLDRAIDLTRRMGLVCDWPISVTHLDTGLLGLCDRELQHIYLSPDLFQQGTKAIVSCLYEEQLHAITGLADCTYEMQTHLFNKIISLYEEHVIDEPI